MTKSRGGSRDAILGAIRRGIGRQGPLPPERAAALEERLSEHARNLVPARAALDHDGQVELFVQMAEEASTTVTRVPSPADAPKALAEYLARQNLPTELTMAPDASLAGIPWDEASMLTIRQGRADPRDDVSVTPAFAGIAETGTLMLTSGPGHPSTLNLLPDTHVVVLPESQVVGNYEEGWDRLRAARKGNRNAGGAMPRTVLFVTGPSRSADIEQTVQLGAHGPRRVHILLIGEDGQRPKAAAS